MLTFPNPQSVTIDVRRRLKDEQKKVNEKTAKETTPNLSPFQPVIKPAIRTVEVKQSIPLAKPATVNIRPEVNPMADGEKQAARQKRKLEEEKAKQAAKVAKEKAKQDAKTQRVTARQDAKVKQTEITGTRGGDAWANAAKAAADSVGDVAGAYVSTLGGGLGADGGMSLGGAAIPPEPTPAPDSIMDTLNNLSTAQKAGAATVTAIGLGLAAKFLL